MFDENYLFLIEGFPGDHGHQNCWNFELACIRMNIQNEIPKTEIQKKNCEILKKFNIQEKYNIRERDKNDPNFDQRIGFYTLSGLDYSIAFDYFDIIRDEDSENLKWDELVTTKEYSVVHHPWDNDPSNLAEMDLSIVKEPIIYLNDNSDKIVDMFKIIEHAKEVHFIDSLYGVLCYYAYFSGKLKGPKFYFHAYARKKIPKFFNYNWIEESDDWVLLD